MRQISTTLKPTARLAGLLYLIMGLTGAYGMMYVPKRIVLWGDTSQIVTNILENEFLFRSGIFILLLSAITSVFCVLVFYKLFYTIDSYLAKLMVAFVIVQVPIFFILETFNITYLMILKGDMFRNLLVEQQNELSTIFLKIHQNGLLLLEVFWGLWLFPLGQLIYKSVFIPRVFGVLLIVAGAGYALDSLAPVLYPSIKILTQPFAYTASGIGELAIILWLLIKGVKK